MEGYLSSKKTEFTESSGKWKTAYEALFKKIEGLLQGATAAGLAKAYEDQKGSYVYPVVIWSLAFTLTIGGMLWFAIVNYETTNKFEDSVTHILSRLPFFIPAIWLAFFSAKRQNQAMRLLQEYSYKKTLAQSYEGFRREIDNLPDSPKKIELLEKQLATMVQMFEHNPSLTLEHKSHEEGPPSFMGLGLPKRKKTPKTADPE